MENNIKIGNTDYQEKKYEEENLEEEYTPKLFSDEKNQVDTETRDQDEIVYRSNYLIKILMKMRILKPSFKKTKF